MIGICQFVHFSFNYHKVGAFFKQHNPFAGYLELFVFLALSRAFFTKKGIYYFQFIILIMGIVVSFSRGGWIGFFVGFIFFLLKNKVKESFYFLGVIVILFFFYLNLPQMRSTGRFKRLFSRDEWKGRIGYYWEKGRIILKKHPFLGVGIGNYREGLKKYGIKMDKYLKMHFHNLYLQMLVETGIIGLAVFLLLLWIHLKEIFRVKEIDMYSIEILGIGCGLLSFLIHNLVDVLTTHNINLILGMELGLLVTFSKNVSR